MGKGVASLELAHALVVGTSMGLATRGVGATNVCTSVAVGVEMNALTSDNAGSGRSSGREYCAAA